MSVRCRWSRLQNLLKLVLSSRGFSGMNEVGHLVADDLAI